MRIPSTAKAWVAAVGATATAVATAVGATQASMADDNLDASEVGAVVTVLLTLAATIYGVWRVPFTGDTRKTDTSGVSDETDVRL